MDKRDKLFGNVFKNQTNIVFKKQTWWSNNNKTYFSIPPSHCFPLIFLWNTSLTEYTVAEYSSLRKNNFHTGLLSSLPRVHWKKSLSHLSWLLSMWRRISSTPSLLRMTKLLTLSLRDCPSMEKANFSRFYPGSRSLGHDPDFMNIREDRNVDRPVNQEL